MRKLIIMLAAAVLLLAACGGKKVDDETANVYIEKAEEVVSLLNEGDTKGIHDMLDENMKEALSDAQLQEVIGIVEGSGAFEKVDKSSVEEKDGDFVTVLAVKYSENTRIFTITFDEKHNVAGLYIK